MSDAADPEQPHRNAATTTEAHTDITGHNARYVLVFGTMAVIALFAIVFLYYFA